MCSATDAEEPRRKTGRDKERDIIIHQKLKDGTLKLYETGEDFSPIRTRFRVRRGFIEQETMPFETISPIPMSNAWASGNCEETIGAVQVPLTLRGLLSTGLRHRKLRAPPRDHGGRTRRLGQPGCSAITKTGGADVRILHDGMTRGSAADSVGQPDSATGEGSSRRTEGGCGVHHIARETNGYGHVRCRTSVYVASRTPRDEHGDDFASAKVADLSRRGPASGSLPSPETCARTRSPRLLTASWAGAERRPASC